MNVKLTLEKGGRFQNFWSNVSKIVIKPTASDEAQAAIVRAVGNYIQPLGGKK